MATRKQRFDTVRAFLKEPEIKKSEAYIYMLQMYRYEFWLAIMNFAQRHGKKVGVWLNDEKEALIFRVEMADSQEKHAP